MENIDIQTRLEQKIRDYQTSVETVRLLADTQLLFLVGISGAGKDSVASRLEKTGKYHRLVSHTTRQPRTNDGVPEQNGVDYHFITLEQAERMLDAHAYVEAKKYGSNVYGTSVAEIRLAHNAGKVAMTDIEIQGMAEYIALAPHTHAIFILPPTYEIWQERFKRRYGATLDQGEYFQRMQRAAEELEHALSVPYFHFVVNDSLDTAVAEIDEIATGNETPEEAAHARSVAQTLVDHLRQNS